MKDIKVENSIRVSVVVAFMYALLGVDIKL